MDQNTKNNKIPSNDTNPQEKNRKKLKKKNTDK